MYLEPKKKKKNVTYSLANPIGKEYYRSMTITKSNLQTHMKSKHGFIHFSRRVKFRKK